jgi:outer membrane protein assembly factor BamB
MLADHDGTYRAADDHDITSCRSYVARASAPTKSSRRGAVVALQLEHAPPLRLASPSASQRAGARRFTSSNQFTLTAAAESKRRVRVVTHFVPDAGETANHRQNLGYGSGQRAPVERQRKVMNKQGAIAALSLSLIVSTTAAVSGQNWPAFRGPHGSGVVSERPLPTSWDGEKSINIRWKTVLPGVGHSSPVVWGDSVFVTTAISSADKLTYNAKDDGIQPATDDSVHEWRVLSLDRNTGRTLWSQIAHRGVPKVKRHVKATQANATAVTDGRFVVVSFGSEGLYAFDMNGVLLWKQDLGVLDPGYAGQPELSWGFASSPVIYRDLVIMQCDVQKNSFIAAFNLKDGKRVWFTERDELPAWSTPVIYEGRERTELVTSGSKYYRGYDPLTGRELWRLRDDTQVKVPSPVVANDLFYLSGGNPRGREFYVVRPNANGDISIGAGQAAGPSIAWRRERGSPYTPTPIVYDGYLYICNDNGVLTVYDAKTGAQVYVHRIGTTNSTFSASPIAANGRIYLSSEDGEVFVIKAGPVYELLAVNRMGEPLMATPAASGGMIFIRGQRHLFAVK